MTKNILILWDIDGTILHSTGAGVTALQVALKSVFGIPGSFEGIEFAGRTDKLIIRQIFSRYSIEYTPANFERYIDGYIAALPRSLVECRARFLPGVMDILGSAAGRQDVAQGLLTGNVRRGAQAKLGHHGLWEMFPVGAFADDSEHRAELGPHALRRARGHGGVDFPPERVWIVGDTPHDIACARAIGARVLAVATGSVGLPALAAHAPDAVLGDLRDPAAFWGALGSAP
jgi:phosphoglycolate phosphatase-like HAD superfamily hydrolase